MNELDEAKKRFLGAAGKIKATYNNEPDFKKLKLPLPPGARVYVFCEACGTQYAVDLTVANMLYFLMRQKDKKLPDLEDFSGHYLHVKCCAFCNAPDNAEVELRKITD